MTSKFNLISKLVQKGSHRIVPDDTKFIDGNKKSIYLDIQLLNNFSGLDNACKE
mgnify:FL=1